MKYAWATDTHLDRISLDERISFYQKLSSYDGVFITGDISNGKMLISHLTELLNEVDKNVYFVLGEP